MRRLRWSGGLGGIVGSPATGLAMQLIGHQGLPASLGLLCGVLAMFLLVQRRRGLTETLTARRLDRCGPTQTGQGVSSSHGHFGPIDQHGAILDTVSMLEGAQVIGVGQACLCVVRV